MRIVFLAVNPHSGDTFLVFEGGSWLLVDRSDEVVISLVPERMTADQAVADPEWWRKLGYIITPILP